MRNSNQQNETKRSDYLEHAQVIDKFLTRLTPQAHCLDVSTWNTAECTVSKLTKQKSRKRRRTTEALKAPLGLYVTTRKVMYSISRNGDEMKLYLRSAARPGEFSPSRA